MRSVVICGSRRFKKEIVEFIAELKNAGVVVFEPILYTNDAADAQNSEEVKRLRRLGLTLHHFSQIRKADVCYIYNKDGYIGISTTAEMGFAAAMGMPIYALAPDTEDPPRGVLIDEVVPTVGELLKKL